MTLSELISHVRVALLRDTAIPALWSDAEITRYLNQATKEFAIRTHAIVDDETPAVVTFDTVVGQHTYDLHASVLRVDEAWIAEYDDDELIGVTELRDRTRGQNRYKFSKGKPCIYTVQTRTNAMRLYPTPDAVHTIEMVVARKPLVDMSSTGDEPEIAEEWHLNLCDYAAYRCLVNNRPEGAEMQAGGVDFKSIWDLAVRDAKRQIASQRAGEKPQARSNWTGKRYRRHG